MHVLPSPMLEGDTVLSLLDSRVILFRANSALPAFYLTAEKSSLFQEIKKLKGKYLKSTNVPSTFA